ncbi:MAG TPA: BamA/TamA family outer membrane protein [Gemmatimonadales bacterium]|nr:BamA/TamA family outer membrane protein [Gemmatimonadales bacterium]
MTLFRRLARDAGLVGLLLLAGGVGALAAQDEGRIVRGLHFVGNKSLDSDYLSAAIGTTNSAWFARSGLVRWIGLGEKRQFDETEFRRDVLRLILLYRQSGFLEVKVDTAVVRKPKEVDVTFKITEGPPIVVTSLAVTGTDSLKGAGKIALDLPLRVGRPFDRFLFQASADTLVSRLRNLGYPSADVLRNFSIDKVARTVQVSLDALPGRSAVYGGVQVKGSQQVDSAFIRQLLELRRGQEFAQRDLDEGQQRLARTQLFRLAAVEIDSSGFQPGDSVVPLVVRVAEGKRFRYRGQVGYATEDCFRVGAGYTDRNMFHSGRSFDLSAGLSKIGVGTPFNFGLENSICPDLKADSIGSSHANYFVTASVHQPRFLSARTNGTISFFGERRSEFQVYRRDEIGAAVQAVYVPKPQLPVSFTYRASFGQTFATPGTFCAFFNACTPEDRLLLSQGRLGATLTGVISSIKTNNIVDPTRGRALSFQTTYSSPVIGSSNLQQFIKFQGDAAWYHAVTRDVTLAWRLRLGLLFSPTVDVNGNATEFVPPEHRFYAGGPNDVRGFDVNGLGPLVYVAQTDSAFSPSIEDKINKGEIPLTFSPTGGNTLGIANIELRLPSPIFPARLRFAVYLDGGVLFQRGETDLAPAEFRVTPGVGLRFGTPIGPIRLDLAYNAYPNTPGPLYLQDSQGNIVFVKSGYSRPRGSGWNLHFAVGQPF